MTFSLELMVNKTMTIVQITQLNQENTLKLVQIIISLLLLLYSGYKFTVHVFFSLKHIIKEMVLVVFWGIILTTSILYLYINSDHTYIKNTFVPFCYSVWNSMIVNFVYK